MKNYDALDVLVSLIVGLFLGLVLGWAVGNEAMKREAIQHHAAHYDSVTAEFKWNQ